MRYEEIREQIRAGTAARTLPAWAEGVLGEILDGAAAEGSPAPAVRHPLGFLCLPVERSGDLGVCLHIWTPEVRPAPSTTSPVHCHSWDLVSFVLYGTVRNVRMDIDDASGGAEQQIFEVVSRDGVDELTATGRAVRCSPGPSSTHRTGESYTLPAGVFHSTLIEDGRDAATIALGRQSPGGGDLSLGPLDVPTHQVRRSRSDHGDTVRALRRSARRIAAAHCSAGR
ncbi:hypothetical protein K8Z49_46250 [Actinomadura madurae]|uniref:Cysteine dioxygenase type I n=2 Tax=Actinomadura madurae TaxID=1993 RepID=A0A1I4XI53_9ACTN|nr:hypothetical protein [Actinomadura madurae]URN00524.1 hypothetical protein LUW76_42950 [Actinomadura madurae]SFN24939.1 hypothetical protein SAMN04489713_101867 [Actinomadura madurae]